MKKRIILLNKFHANGPDLEFTRKFGRCEAANWKDGFLSGNLLTYEGCNRGAGKSRSLFLFVCDSIQDFATTSTLSPVGSVGEAL